MTRWSKWSEIWYVYSPSLVLLWKSRVLKENQRICSKTAPDTGYVFRTLSGHYNFRTRIFPDTGIFSAVAYLSGLQHIKISAKNNEPFLRKLPKTSKNGHFRHFPDNMSGTKSKIENRALSLFLESDSSSPCQISEKSIQPISLTFVTHGHTDTHTDYFFTHKLNLRSWELPNFPKGKRLNFFNNFTSYLWWNWK